jgi:hypothetical protein
MIIPTAWHSHAYRQGRRQSLGRARDNLFEIAIKRALRLAHFRLSVHRTLQHCVITPRHQSSAAGSSAALNPKDLSFAA